jgi:serine/threonine protein phosphatase 1
MKRTIAIGDIHGCAKTFFALIEKLDISEEDEIILLGDYIDRGPDSKGVINTIMALIENDYNIKCLLGNHEEIMFVSETGFYPFSTWITNGGDATLENFEVDFFNEMPKAYQDFFKACLYYYETDKYIFVHAGLNFANENIFEDKEAMLWIRRFADNQPKLGNKIMIHGHTPKPLQEILNQKGNCINIDGGCVYIKEKQTGLGNLVAIILETMEYVWVENQEEAKEVKI